MLSFALFIIRIAIAAAVKSIGHLKVFYTDKKWNFVNNSSEKPLTDL